MTLAEWADLDEDEPGELVEELLVEDEEVGYLHEVLVMWLGWTLRSWLASRGGFVGGSDVRFGLSPSRGRKPDVSVYLPGRRPPARGLVTIPPDIMIEVVSPRPRDARRDRVEKMDEYATFRCGPRRTALSPRARASNHPTTPADIVRAGHAYLP
jgi:Uma2 family endonuclease